MDAAGIDMQVLSLSGIGMDMLDPATATTLARGANDKLAAAVQAHPDRFAAFATLALLEPEKAAFELERCVL
jgi:predicted TIM-barrel fold metal-dependent hydrolase